jgi:hypothetical protein
MAAALQRGIARDELMRVALHQWPVEWVEEAAGRRGVALLPEPVRTARLAARVPRYLSSMAEYLAEQQGTTVGHVVTLALHALADEYYDQLKAGVAGFALAFDWPYVPDEGERGANASVFAAKE